MIPLRTLKKELLADGQIEDAAVEVIRRELYTDNRIDKRAVEFLLELRREARSLCPAFEGLFFQVLKDNVLQDGFIDPDETHWLRQLLLVDGTINDRAREFLRDLKREARRTSLEFQILYGELMN